MEIALHVNLSESEDKPEENRAHIRNVSKTLPGAEGEGYCEDTELAATLPRDVRKRLQAKLSSNEEDFFAIYPAIPLGLPPFRKMARNPISFQTNVWRTKKTRNQAATTKK